ncbi:hypothetical protein LSAT2_017093 [Lamellibrachia satsuma]|nr:hypothetical protein LSAT2_017093 [Lamellibrachia satsuma]
MTPAVITQYLQKSKGAKPARAPKPPADPNRSLRQSASKQRLYQRPFSPTFESQSSHGRAASLHDVSMEEAATVSAGKISETGRRVQSGPKERTKQLVEERGEGDGSEMTPRVYSRSSTHQAAEGEDPAKDCAGHTLHNTGHPVIAAKGKGSSRQRPDIGKEVCYYREHVAPVIEQIVALIADKDHDKLAMLTQQLYDVLAKGQLLGRVCQQRSTILKTLFKLLDLSSPSTLLKLARLILASSLIITWWSSTTSDRVVCEAR